MLPFDNSKPWGRLRTLANMVDLLDFLGYLSTNLINKKTL
jgi:hypothetical protein